MLTSLYMAIFNCPKISWWSIFGSFCFSSNLTLTLLQLPMVRKSPDLEIPFANRSRCLVASFAVQEQKLSGCRFFRPKSVPAAIYVLYTCSMYQLVIACKLGLHL